MKKNNAAAKRLWENFYTACLEAGGWNSQPKEKINMTSFKLPLYSSDSGLLGSLNWLPTGAEVLALRGAICRVLQDTFE